jgi:PAS domain S-box-containing protein
LQFRAGRKETISVGMKKPPRTPVGPEDSSSQVPRAGISRRRPPIAADRAMERHLRALTRRPGDARILSRLPDAVVSFDRDWRFVFVNKQVERNHQLPASDFLGRVVWEMFPEAKELESYRQYLAALESQDEVSYDEYVPLLGRWFEQRLFPSPEGLTVIARDVTQWRETESERARLSRELAQIAGHGRRGLAADVRARAMSGSMPAATAAGINPLRTFSTLFPRPGRRATLVARIRESGAFEAAVRDAAALSVELQAADDPTGPVVITALWRDAADYARWQQHPERAAILAELDEHLEEMCIERYEVVRRAAANPG